MSLTNFKVKGHWRCLFLESLRCQTFTWEKEILNNIKNKKIYSNLRGSTKGLWLSSNMKVYYKPNFQPRSNGWWTKTHRRFLTNWNVSLCTNYRKKRHFLIKRDNKCGYYPQGHFQLWKIASRPNGVQSSTVPIGTLWTTTINNFQIRMNIRLKLIWREHFQEKMIMEVRIWLISWDVSALHIP